MITKLDINGVLKIVKLDSISFNESLLYALSRVSGDSENEITTYFYNLGMTLFNDCISRKKLPKRCNRKVKIFYKDTSLFIAFTVWSDFFASRYSDTISIRMEVTVPQSFKRVYGRDVEDMLMETGLQIGESPIMEISAPQSEVYKCLKNVD